MKRRLLAWSSAAVTALILISGLFAPQKTPFDLKAFGTLPVLHQGRIKPLDTVARTTLLVLHGKQTLQWDGKSVNPTQWFLETITNPQKADEVKVFYETNPEVLGLMGLAQSQEKYLSFNDLKPYIPQLENLATQAQAVDARHRTAFQREILLLNDRAMTYFKLKNTLQAEGSTLSEDVAGYQKSLQEALPLIQKEGLKAAQDNHDAVGILALFFHKFDFLNRSALFLAVPTHTAINNPSQWTSLGTAFLKCLDGKTPLNPAIIGYGNALSAYSKNQPEPFNRAVHQMLDQYGQDQPWFMFKIRSEVQFNASMLFIVAIALYALAFLIIFIGWMVKPEWCMPIATGILGTTFLAHTIGLGLRMWFQGRPPVTNLYSSAVFIGWAVIVMALILEKLYRNSIPSLIAALTGFLTLIIAHHLSLQGDTLEMMQAVLDSNFWLSTHVVTVTIGYSATFLAGFLAIVYVLRGVFSKSLDAETQKNLVRMVYGTLCFALLFSFIGTVLGGIWADQSWGRFWGWDPKENGALLIVLWCAVVLHTRLAGLIKPRGLMVMAIFGNIVTSFSWFGVNMLGVGLHSYGFMEQAFLWLVLFVFSQLLLMWIGSLPLPYWKSHIDQ
ncbi:MAG: cytochrome c biogenesis protein [Candidatus Margulisiibacteriota bacterium]